MMEEDETGDAEITSQVCKALETHLGRDPQNAFNAKMINIAAAHIDNARGWLGAMNRKNQEEALYKIGQLLRELVRAKKTLHDAVDWEIVHGLTNAAEDPGHDPGPEDDLNERQKDLVTTWDTLSGMSQIIDRITPDIKHFIRAAPDEGKRDMRMIVIVDFLSDIWAKRKGVTARKQVEDANPFTRFVADVFTALGEDYDARSSVNSWYQYQKKYPNPKDWRVGRPRK